MVVQAHVRLHYWDTLRGLLARIRAYVSKVCPDLCLPCVHADARAPGGTTPHGSWMARMGSGCSCRGAWRARGRAGALQTAVSVPQTGQHVLCWHCFFCMLTVWGIYRASARQLPGTCQPSAQLRLLHSASSTCVHACSELCFVANISCSVCCRTLLDLRTGLLSSSGGRRCRAWRHLSGAGRCHQVPHSTMHCVALHGIACIA